MATTETFTGAAAPLTSPGSFAVGNYTATSGSRANAGQYGGAGGAGQYLAVGNGTITVALAGDRKYVGFWWSAGDASNEISFFDTGNNLLAKFTTATLVGVLSGGGSITAIDGSAYAKSAYFGNPNTDPRSNAAEPYGYINLLLQGTSVRFARIEIKGSNFELDNLAIADAPPVDPAWVNYGNQTVTLPPGAVGAADDAGSTPINTPYSANAAANDTAPAGSTWTKSSNPANGTVTVNPNGSYVYVPANGFVGVDSFTYSVCKAAPDQAQCADATVRITVGLDAVDDAISTTPGTPVTASVPNNDAFPKGSIFTVSSSPSKGAVSLDPATGVYTYTPGSSYTGTDSFQYRLCLPAPNSSQCDTATVTITSNANVVPVASSVTIAGAPAIGMPLTGKFVYSDANSDAQAPASYRWVRSPSSTTTAGSFSVGNGITYTPSASDVGSYLFFCVTPRAQTGASPGVEVCTAASAVNGGAPATVTAAASAIPTLSEWGILLMSLLLALTGWGMLRRRI